MATQPAGPWLQTVRRNRRIQHAILELACPVNASSTVTNVRLPCLQVHAILGIRVAHHPGADEDSQDRVDHPQASYHHRHLADC